MFREDGAVLTTGDGKFKDGYGVGEDPETGLPSIWGNFVVDLTPEDERIFNERLSGVEVVSRSGLAQGGFEVKSDSPPQIIEGSYLTRVKITSLMGKVGKPVLERLLDLSRSPGSNGATQIGRLLWRDPSKAVTRDEILSAIEEDQLWLPEGYSVAEDGVVEIPLEQLHYIMALQNLISSSRRDYYLRLGRHALAGIRDIDPRSFPDSIASNKYFLGAMKISLGRYFAVIEPALSVDGEADDNVFHLAARVLDPIRTMGGIRQVEIFNGLDRSVSTKDLKIRVRLYPADETTEFMASRLVNSRTIRRGLHFSDVMKIEQSPKRMLELMSLVSVDASDGHDLPQSWLIAGGRAARVGWGQTPSLQADAVKAHAEGLLGNKEGYRTDGTTPDLIKSLTEMLRYVGGEYHQGRVVVSQAFPDPALMTHLLDHGIGDFVATDLRLTQEMCLPELRDPDAESNPYNDLYFDDGLYAHFKAMERRGAHMFMVFPELEVRDNNGGGVLQIVPAHVREFYRGFWVRPEEKKRFKKVDTVFAIYGSHVEGIDDLLAEQLDGFMARMKKILGNRMGIIHGKGPGVMKQADEAAKKHKIVRMGVGIGVEKLGQAPNFEPEAIVDLIDRDRLSRQNPMDNINTFPIFNLGGGGTLEELAITLCSQKLGKNLPMPMVLVDPVGWDDGEHIFTKFAQQVDVLVQKKKITKGQGEHGKAALLAGFNRNYIHLVDSLDEAADIYEDFLSDPIGYYERCEIPYAHLRNAWENAELMSEETGFAIPHFITEDMVKSESTCIALGGDVADYDDLSS